MNANMALLVLAVLSWWPMVVPPDAAPAAAPDLSSASADRDGPPAVSARQRDDAETPVRVARPAPAPPPLGESSDAAPAIGPSRWYGWQLLLADLSFVALVETKSPAMVTAGAMGLTLGAPLLHGLNGDLRMAATSLAVRGAVTLGVVGLLSPTESMCERSDTICELGHTGVSLGAAFIAVGLALGRLVFAAVEDVGLSTTTALPAWKRPASPSFTVAPTLAPTVTRAAGATSAGLAAGIVGTF